MAVDVEAAAMLPVFCSARLPPRRGGGLCSAAVERVNLVPRTCEVVLVLLAIVVVLVEVVVVAVVAVLLLLLLLLLLFLLAGWCEPAEAFAPPL